MAACLDAQIKDRSPYHFACSGTPDLKFIKGFGLPQQQPPVPNITVSQSIPDLTSLLVGGTESVDLSTYVSGSDASGATYAINAVSGNLAQLGLAFSGTTLSSSDLMQGSGVFSLQISKNGYTFSSNNFAVKVSVANTAPTIATIPNFAPTGPFSVDLSTYVSGTYSGLSINVDTGTLGGSGWSLSGTILTYTPTVSLLGAVIPSATQIIDASNNVWTLGAATAGPGQAVYEDGVLAGTSFNVILLLYFNNLIYQENSSDQWFYWNGSTWIATTDPRVVSTSGTTIPTAQEIVDASSNVWILAGGGVYKNGLPAGTTSGVTLLLYYSGTVYYENASAAWFSWSGTAWVSAAGDPRSNVPAPAAALGYVTNTFSSTLYDPTGATGPLYPYNFFGASQSSGTIVQNSDGSITFSGAGAGVGVCCAYQDSSQPHKWRGDAFGGGGYFEIEAEITGTPTGSQPTAAFALNDVENVSTGYDPLSPLEWMEFDVFESNVGGAHATTEMGIAIHPWYGTRGSGNQVQPSIGSPATIPSGGNINGKHFYGMAWQVATSSSQGWVQFYYDRVAVGSKFSWNQYVNGQAFPPTLTPPTAGNITDQRHLIFTFGGAPATPMTVYACNVWQASAAGNIHS